MTFQAALLNYSGRRFAVLIVAPGTIRSPLMSQELRVLGAQMFGSVPILLMEQDAEGNPKYAGRKELVEVLTGIPVDEIPWQSYTI